MKSYRFYILIFLTALTGVLLLESTKKKAINWFPSYASHDKIPYGSYVFHEILKRKTADGKLIENRIPPFELLMDSTLSGTFFFVNDQVYFGEDESEKLLDFVSRGNALFVASEKIESFLLDTLGLETSIVDDEENFDNLHTFNLSFPKLHAAENYPLEKSRDNFYFSKLDSTAVVLGTTNFVKEKDSINTERPNFISVPFGEGKIYLLTFPEAFTNFFLLKDNNKNYTAGAISYVDFAKSVIFDNYHKNGKIYYNSPLHVVLENFSLRWAYYLMLTGVLLYVIFQGKRKQRAIPIFESTKNQSIAFIRTIAYQFFTEKNHREIAKLKAVHFLKFVREQLLIDLAYHQKGFAEILSQKTNFPIEKVQKLIDLISRAEKNEAISSEDLITFDQYIHTLKNTSL